jgi:hypothetical protein
MAIFQILVSDTSEKLVTVDVDVTVQVEVSGFKATLIMSLQSQEVSESVSGEAVAIMMDVRRCTKDKVFAFWLLIRLTKRQSYRLTVQKKTNNILPNHWI